MNTQYKLRLLACVSALAATPVYAQSPENQAAETQQAQDDSTEGAAQTIAQEIVVTARKKSAAERAQDVPISLTAVSGAQIEAQFAKNLADVGLTMPNVRLDNTGSSPGVANYAIRGMGFNSTISSVEPTVGVFVDGLYIGANLGGAPDTYDLESVEVLRGPQGTLFGRNVTGGAIVMRSRRPTGEFGGVVRAGAGSGGRWMIGGGVEGSLSDTVAAKIYAQYNRRSGDFDLLYPELSGGRKHAGKERDVFVRPILRFRPNSDVDITLIGEYGTVKGDGSQSRIVDDPLSTFTYNAYREPKNAHDLIQTFPGHVDIEWKQIVLEANWDIGPGTITSITGYRDVRFRSQGESDGSPLQITLNLNNMDQDQFSQELRFAGKAFDDKLDYTIGAYYFQQNIEQFYHVRFDGAPPFDFPASSQRSRGKLDHKTWSVFAQGDFEFLPHAFLTLGGRYTWEKKTPLIGRTADCLPPPPAPSLALEPMICTLSPVPEGSKTWHNFTPKVGLSWKATEDILLYASWTKGFRSGGYNIRTTGTVAGESPGPFEPETVKAIEAGIKTEFLDGRARVNAAIFQNKFTNLQRTVNDGQRNFIANAADSTIKGFEVEGTFLPFRTLALTGNVGYLDAKYKNYHLLIGGVLRDLSGKQLIRAPKWSYTLSATHDLSLGSAGNLASRVSFSYNGKTPMNDANDYFTPSFHLLDGSLTWSPEGNRDLKVSLWGKNLTNKTYALLGTIVRPYFTILYQSLPRTFGAEVTYRFSGGGRSEPLPPAPPPPPATQTCPDGSVISADSMCPPPPPPPPPAPDQSLKAGERG